MNLIVDFYVLLYSMKQVLIFDVVLCCVISVVDHDRKSNEDVHNQTQTFIFLKGVQRLLLLNSVYDLSFSVHTQVEVFPSIFKHYSSQGTERFHIGF